MVANMRQRASLDIIADDRGAPLAINDAEPEAETGQTQGVQEDSRSTSSTSSPAPPDNEESDFFLGANDSQSSLGVPNLQDMLVDDECIPPINRLPNEILIVIFTKLSSLSDVLHVMLTCKRWARNSVDILWHRPSCTSWEKHSLICRTLTLEEPYFAYRDFIKRLNLASLHETVNDGSVLPLASCTRVERLTLTNCNKLTDSGLIPLISNNNHLLALDISNDDQITEASINAIAQHCNRLQGLNVTACTKISNESMINLAKSCKYLKRLKLNDCSQLNDDAILAFAEYCPNILEIDLLQCRLIGNEPVTQLVKRGQALRELRLANCELIDDGAFLSLPSRTYEHLRILDLTSCVRLTDRAVEKIIDVAPRLRNLVFAKCRNLTDAAVYAISRLGKNLHFLHLGHCGHITDDAVKRLVSVCNRIRYIDLGCCTKLTDDSVTRLALLPKLKRIGLVKCANITDASVIALANANRRSRLRKDAYGNPITTSDYSSHGSSLERVHLSYCVNLTLKSIIRLLNSCPRLTHLSLTGVQAFLREDLEAFSRPAPPEFTEHQRAVFCVFSGQGVTSLRKYLNQERSQLATDQDGLVVTGFGEATPPPGAPLVPADLDETELDGDDDDALDDEMAIDGQPLPVAAVGGHTIPPPPPPPSQFTTYMGLPLFPGFVGSAPPHFASQLVLGPSSAEHRPETQAQQTPPHHLATSHEPVSQPQDQGIWPQVDFRGGGGVATSSNFAAQVLAQQASGAGPSSANSGGASTTPILSPEGTPSTAVGQRPEAEGQTQN
ncbi:SCF E3 ubiquitin ligase complex F-box protein grrA [Podospora australis]|uniref:SCF E3 ubiquitin ligase complex F-box protein grrA n=1 Tax=Podospora australis TaxID=1536484 RepID=A0AAN6WZM6_9PEZI|nr:SCF E3 ubiquitin ligase complex F-box protein grrA [Podospora australis]